jgi:hypothetical protein
MGVENFVNAESSAGNRSTKRARVLLAAKLETPFGEVDARLRDLSRKGALVECLQVPPAGTKVTFVRGKSRIPARIAWAADNRVGLEFACMIDEHELLVQLGKPVPAKPQSYSRPGLNAPMTEQDRKLAQAWSVSVGLTLPEREP